MKAICVDESRDLRLREIPEPSAPPPGYVTVRIEAAAINHGDKTFLRAPEAAGAARGLRLQNVWGASAAGRVTRIGASVPGHYLDRKVAIYRSLQADRPLLGLWCETAQVPALACLPLPEHVDTKDYSGSLVNVVTAYAFLEEAAAGGHRAVLVTAGGSGTGRAMAALARRRDMPTLIVVRNSASRAALLADGMTYVLASDDADFLRDLEHAALELRATAVFDGVGGVALSRMLRALAPTCTIWFYGFLSGAEQVTFPSSLFMMKDLTMRRFSTFESSTVRDPLRLARMLANLESCIDDPMLRTRLGRTFDLSEFAAAMTYEGTGGRKAIFTPWGESARIGEGP